jgi:dihydropteroate synthase
MDRLTQTHFDTSGRRMGGYGRTLVMGILNVTPDSFSDGGRYDAVEAAVAHALAMERDGADIIDIGAESTRPGHEKIDTATELARIMPVLEALRGRLMAPLSIDTTKAAVADEALRAGASIINDIWGLVKDPALAELAARHEAGLVIMHNREEIDASIDIVADMQSFLRHSRDRALAAGVPQARIALDPGIGFGKTLEQNYQAITRLAALKALDCPLLVGVSRKSLIGKIVTSKPEERLPGTIALHTAAILNGAEIIRVHDVSEAFQAARVTDFLKEYQ